MALIPSSLASIFFLFFFNDTATTEIYTLSLHDALPISQLQTAVAALAYTLRARRTPAALSVGTDGERPGAAEPHDLVRGGYVGIPRRGPNPGAPGDPSRHAPAPRHPWRTTFSPRQRRLTAAKRGRHFLLPFW